MLFHAFQELFPIRLRNHAPHLCFECLLHILDCSEGGIERLDDEGGDHSQDDSDQESHGPCRSGFRRIDRLIGE